MDDHRENRRYERYRVSAEVEEMYVSVLVTTREVSDGGAFVRMPSQNGHPEAGPHEGCASSAVEARAARASDEDLALEFVGA